ncbi:lysostaphin resistance A-like protein [Enterococcus sp. AZ109]|uniref:CPBP family intramembrane glutamic endopeptidase n=1 Tax=Enterococcus sp. AZ109 TaxID=2774634 RepID=UPI003F1E8DC7
MDTRIENRQLKIFLTIAFGLPVIMGLFMWYGYSNDKDLNLFSLTHMYYPAAGAMIALLTSSQHKKLIPTAFFLIYLIQTVIMMALSLSGLFIVGDSLVMIGNWVMIVGTIALWIAFFVTKKDRRAAFGLRGKNWKLTFGLILLFAALYTLLMTSSAVLGGTFSALVENFSQGQTWLMLFVTLANYFLVFTPYLGEEYGWRYFLQPILQKKFGMIKGVLLLGIGWGIWHLPLNFFFYTSPADGLISVTNQIVVCITMGIFIGFVYMKTDNIWIAVVIHYLNNNLSLIFSGDFTGESMSGYSIGWPDVALMAILLTIIYVWPTLTKFFRNRRNLNPTPEERAADATLESSGEQENTVVPQPTLR